MNKAEQMEQCDKRLLKLYILAKKAFGYEVEISLRDFPDGFQIYFKKDKRKFICKLRWTDYFLIRTDTKKELFWSSPSEKSLLRLLRKLMRLKNRKQLKV